MTADLILKISITITVVYIIILLLSIPVSFVYFFTQSTSQNYIEEFEDFFWEKILLPTLWIGLIVMLGVVLTLSILLLLKMWGL